MTSFTAALTGQAHREACGLLIRPDGQEDLCFALWHPSQGRTRFTALLSELVLPQPGEREVHGNASLAPAYLQRALGVAMERGSGLAFMHSHPAPGWQGMSGDDVEAEQTMAAQARACTGLPLVGLTVDSDELWSARFWEKTARQYVRTWCESTRVVGEGFAVTFND